MLNGTRQRLLVYHVVMAARKPKGIVDDIYKGVTNIVSPWLGTPPGELKQVTQFKEATRVAAETLDQTVAGGMVKAGTQGNAALVKQAGVNAAALATGYIAGKAIQTAAGAVTSGRVVNPIAAVKNIVQGKKVVVIGTKSDDVFRGTDKRGYEKWISNPISKGDILPTISGVVKPPQTIYPTLKETAVRWGFDPSKSKSMRELTESVTDYTNRWYGQSNLTNKNNRLEFGGWTTPEIAITKIPKSALSYEPVMPNYPMTDAQDKAIKAITRGVGSVNNPVFRSGAVASTSPAKVVSTVSPVLQNINALGAKYGARKSVDVVERELMKAIKRAGGKVPKKR